MAFIFDRTIKLGDLLTSASILISALTLVFALTRDHSAKDQQLANEVRSASARTLESLERWRFIALSFFDEIRPLLNAPSAPLSSKDKDKKKSIDPLFSDLRLKILDRERLVKQSIHSEKIAASYVDLYKFNPTIKPFFEATLRLLSDANAQMLEELLGEILVKILESDLDGVDSFSRLGITLWDVASDTRTKFDKTLQEILEPAEKFLGEVITKPDAVLLVQTNLQAPEPAPVLPDPILPNAKLTPGDVDIQDAKEICKAGFSQGRRPDANEIAILRSQIFRAYGVRRAPDRYEFDHLIPISLGGTPGAKANLWPQSFDTMPWNARVKDALENYLRREVCAGRIQIGTAQKEIASDWIATYKKYLGEPKLSPAD